MAASNPESKADESKAGGKESRPSPAAQVAASKRSAGGGGEPAPSDGERSAQDIILENLPTIVVVLLIATGLVILAVHRGRQQQQVSEAAWTALGEVKRNSEATPEDYQRLYREHGETSAAPYIQIAWASKLYETGDKEKVEQSREILERVAAEYGAVPLVQQLVPAQIERIQAELADSTVPWAAASEADDARDDDAAPLDGAADADDAAPLDGAADADDAAPLDDAADGDAAPLDDAAGDDAAPLDDAAGDDAAPLGDAADGDAAPLDDAADGDAAPLEEPGQPEGGE